MRRFKLIKEYPESPELGTIADYSKEHRVYVCKGGRYFAGLDRYVVENHPEFWEEVIEYPIGTKVHNSQTNTIYTKQEDGWYKPTEKTAYTDEMISNRKHLTVLDKSEKVVEKDYEILSFSHPGGLTTLRDNGYYVYAQYLPSDCYNGKGSTLNEILNNEEFCNCKIHSVRRLSDGEIFTVGDLCNLSNGNGYRNPILRFEISYNSFGLEKYRNRETLKFILGTEIENKTEWGPFELDNCVHSKKPLFTTEDGVEVFEGDMVSWVIDGEYCYDLPLISLHLKVLNVGGETYKIFSTRELAEEYLMVNKPSLSINDIKQAIGLTAFDYVLLKKFVKDKK